MLPFDLHVLGMPPAFNLSQDQTLQFYPVLVKLASFTALSLAHSNLFKHPHSLSSIFLMNLPSRRAAYSTHLGRLVKHFFQFSLIFFPSAFINVQYPYI
jgi:hypothetical protein